jgi:hypothetical protein
MNFLPILTQRGVLADPCGICGLVEKSWPFVVSKSDDPFRRSHLLCLLLERFRICNTAAVTVPLPSSHLPKHYAHVSLNHIKEIPTLQTTVPQRICVCYVKTTKMLYAKKNSLKTGGWSNTTRIHSIVNC